MDLDKHNDLDKELYNWASHSHRVIHTHTHQVKVSVWNSLEYECDNVVFFSRWFDFVFISILFSFFTDKRVKVLYK